MQNKIAEQRLLLVVDIHLLVVDNHLGSATVEAVAPPLVLIIPTPTSASA